MAAIALPRPLPAHRPSSGLDALPPTAMLEPVEASPAPIPNKHIPVCPPGPIPHQDSTSSPSPPPRSQQQEEQITPLHPAQGFPSFRIGDDTLYEIDARGIASALDFSASQPIPEPESVFPWMHGLHGSNHLQMAFFAQKKRASRRTPDCLRGITIVKADGDLDRARLRGAISPNEFMQSDIGTQFLDADPRDGFSARNFQIQAAKAALTSDIIVYGDAEEKIRQTAQSIASAQRRRRQVHGTNVAEFNTFVCTSPFCEFEQDHPDLVAVDSNGFSTGRVLDFAQQERNEMYAMTSASEIAHNVWLGPSPEPDSEEAALYDILIECADLATLNVDNLRNLVLSDTAPTANTSLEFPASGSILPPTWSHTEADGILQTCKYIHHLAHGTRPKEVSCDQGGEGATTDSAPSDDVTDDEVHEGGPQKKILIHCGDGYTETTMLAIAYASYSSGRPVPDAWLHLHKTQKRNFFAYPTDVALLTALAPRLLSESPLSKGRDAAELAASLKDEPKWLANLDGSFPSRIQDYMYLGNLGHANNPDLLRALGIGQILSVGETAMWRDGELEEWGEDNVYVVEGVQDNGIDPLTDRFDQCLDFIDRGRERGTATFVHCRVGVSRSATICIAEIMRTMGLSFPEAYCFVRARRLNVIIQPHLRFAYELLKWDETLQLKRTGTIKRQLEWAHVCREIARLNSPYK